MFFTNTYLHEIYYASIAFELYTVKFNSYKIYALIVNSIFFRKSCKKIPPSFRRGRTDEKVAPLA